MPHPELSEERQDLIARGRSVPFRGFAGRSRIAAQDRIDDGLVLAHGTDGLRA